MSHPPARLDHAPYAWWLVGLGHLGQAYAWVISLLGYERVPKPEIVLQDTDIVTDSTYSTGVLTRPSTPWCAKHGCWRAHSRPPAWTRASSRDLARDLRVQDTEAHVALLGVDNLPTRRLTSGVGWTTAIDVGLGTGQIDFASLLLRRFPGHMRSDQVPAWQHRPGDQIEVPDKPAFNDLENRTDACGLVNFAGKAVGASFVGVAAACLAVAEACRELHGGIGHDVLTFDLLTAEVTAAFANAPANVVSRPLSAPSHKSTTLRT